MNVLDHVPDGVFVDGFAKVPQGSRALVEAGWVPMLDQPDVWLTSEGAWVSVDEMDSGHVSNLVRWMERHAEGLRWRWLLSVSCGPLSARGDMAVDAQDRWLDEETERPALAWLADRRLYAALRKKLAERPAPEPVELPEEVAS